MRQELKEVEIAQQEARNAVVLGRACIRLRLTCSACSSRHCVSSEMHGLSAACCGPPGQPCRPPPCMARS